MDDNNDGVTPPPDVGDWCAAVAKVGRPIAVVLVEMPSGRWRLASAEQSRVQVGPGPYDLTPIDHNDAVREALQGAGKPVD